MIVSSGLLLFTMQFTFRWWFLECFKGSISMSLLWVPYSGFLTVNLTSWAGKTVTVDRIVPTALDSRRDTGSPLIVAEFSVLQTVMLFIKSMPRMQPKNIPVTASTLIGLVWLPYVIVVARRPILFMRCLLAEWMTMSHGWSWSGSTGTRSGLMTDLSHPVSINAVVLDPLIVTCISGSRCDSFLGWVVLIVKTYFEFESEWGVLFWSCVVLLVCCEFTALMIGVGVGVWFVLILGQPSQFLYRIWYFDFMWSFTFWLGSLWSNLQVSALLQIPNFAFSKQLFSSAWSFAAPCHDGCFSLR